MEHARSASLIRLSILIFSPPTLSPHPSPPFSISLLLIPYLFSHLLSPFPSLSPPFPLLPSLSGMGSKGFELFFAMGSFGVIQVHYLYLYLYLYRDLFLEVHLKVDLEPDLEPFLELVSDPELDLELESTIHPFPMAPRETHQWRLQETTSSSYMCVHPNTTLFLSLSLSLFLSLSLYHSLSLSLLSSPLKFTSLSLTPILHLCFVCVQFMGAIQFLPACRMFLAMCPEGAEGSFLKNNFLLQSTLPTSSCYSLRSVQFYSLSAFDTYHPIYWPARARCFSLFLPNCLLTSLCTAL